MGLIYVDDYELAFCINLCTSILYSHILTLVFKIEKWGKTMLVIINY